jgi:hypothetical protein
MTPDFKPLVSLVFLMVLAPGFFLAWYGFLLWKSTQASLSFCEIALDVVIALLAGSLSWTATALIVIYWRLL